LYIIAGVEALTLKKMEQNSTLKSRLSEHPQRKLTTLVYEFLSEHGATTPFQIARTLNLDPTAVRDALKKLQKQGKIRLGYLPRSPKRIVPPRVPTRILQKVENQLESTRIARLK